MESTELHKVIEALSKDKETSLTQISIVRLVAESMVQDIQTPNYFTKVCKDFVEIFKASICALYWFRRREPSGWWLEAWSCSSIDLSPASRMISLEDEGIPWDTATEGLRQLSLQFAKSKNYKTLELILQQIGVLKAKPKPGEEATELKYEVTLTGGSVEDLKRSLADLQQVLRID